MRKMPVILTGFAIFSKPVKVNDHFVGDDLIKVITGVRRCWVSYELQCEDVSRTITRFALESVKIRAEVAYSK